MDALRMAMCVAAVALAGCAPEEHASGRVLGFERLMEGPGLTEAVPYSEFLPSARAGTASNRFSGALELVLEPDQIGFELRRDELDLVSSSGRGMDTLPDFRFEFLQVESHLVPVEVGPFQSDHPWWEFVLATGAVWDEPGEEGYSRAAVPFALKERNADCTHNGALTFLFDDNGRISRVALQVVGQTCRYLQFEMAGLFSARYQRYRPEAGERAERAFLDNRAHRMRQRPIAQLATDYPGADPSEFGSSEEIDPGP